MGVDMPIMQPLPFTIRCQSCQWTLSESSDAIDLPYACPRCGQTKLKYEAKTRQTSTDILLPKNDNASVFINYLKRLLRVS